MQPTQHWQSWWLDCRKLNLYSLLLLTRVKHLGLRFDTLASNKKSIQGD